MIIYTLFVHTSAGQLLKVCRPWDNHLMAPHLQVLGQMALIQLHRLQCILCMLVPHHPDIINLRRVVSAHGLRRLRVAPLRNRRTGGGEGVIYADGRQRIYAVGHS